LECGYFIAALVCRGAALHFARMNFEECRRGKEKPLRGKTKAEMNFRTPNRKPLRGEMMP